MRIEIKVLVPDISMNVNVTINIDAQCEHSLNAFSLVTLQGYTHKYTYNL